MKTIRTSSILKVAGKIAKMEAEKINSKWPFCIGILHQPKRPAKK